MRLYVVVPAGFDDPTRPSGGNSYDQRVCAGLVRAGWELRITALAGNWPRADEHARSGLAQAITAMPDGATVLIDGLIASVSAPELLVHASRLRLVILLHMPLATAHGGDHTSAELRSEAEVLTAVAGVVVTSDWTRQQVLGRFPVAVDRVRVARPGVDLAVRARTRSVPPVDGHLLCVAAVAPHKGQDVLVAALARLDGGQWDCRLVGPLDRDPAFVDRLRSDISGLGLVDQVRLAGVLTGHELHCAYAEADLLVVPSRSETYGMVVGEAVARGIPVLASDIGGLPEALGRTADGGRPGTLVTPNDPDALAGELTRWQQDETHRNRLRSAAAERRMTLQRWAETVDNVASALIDLAGPS